MIAATFKRNMQKNSPLCVQFIKSCGAAESIKGKHINCEHGCILSWFLG